MENKKKNSLPYIAAACAGIIFCTMIALLSCILLKHLADLAGGIGTLIRADQKQTVYIVQILEQLKTADFALPWKFCILAGTVLGIAGWCLIRRWKRKNVIGLGILLLLPLLVSMIGFTKVNGVSLFPFFTGNKESSFNQELVYDSQGENWHVGFGRRQILPDETSTQPLYIAGYNNGWEITDVLDYCEARAVWMDTGEAGILLIGVDCIALDSGTVQTIRNALSDLPECISVNVYSTHTHAGADTLGLWGPVGVDGKNDAYMANLIRAAEEAGREAAANRKKGDLYYGQVKTRNMYRDSREPVVYDENLYQLRFEPEDNSEGVRLYFYGAHAESLRGNNSLLSRDFAGKLCDGVTEATGDHTMFFPGAIGGLIMTREIHKINTPEDAVKNLEVTAFKLINDALSIKPENERKIAAELSMSRHSCMVPMDNIGFLLFKFLGILNNKAVPAESATGFGVETEVSVIVLDNLAVTLIPGEIFPELVYGGTYGNANPDNENPMPLLEIASGYGMDHLLIIGLANDEIGYIVPPSDFLVNERLPYLEKTMDEKGENHYEETNSIGPECAGVIAKTFELALESLMLN